MLLLAFLSSCTDAGADPAPVPSSSGQPGIGGGGGSATGGSGAGGASGGSGGKGGQGAGGVAGGASLEDAVLGDFTAENLARGGYTTVELLPDSGANGSVDDAIEGEPNLRRLSPSSSRTSAR